MKWPKTLAACAVAGAAVAAYVAVLRPRHLRWGTTDAEATEPLPGDELMPRPRVAATHAITIDAPPQHVWPWIVQIGQDRGGFYSYTLLENAFGCHMKNADRILPQFQDRQVGDLVWFHPKAPPIPITRLEPGKLMVIGPFWTFLLRPLGSDKTRLIIRCRGTYSGITGAPSYYGFWEPAHFIMERKMMLRIKELSEQRSPARPESLAELTEAA